MKRKGIFAGLMGVGFVVAAILVHEEHCDPAMLILGAIVMALVSGLAAAIVVEKISSFYVFIDVAVAGIYLYYVIKAFWDPKGPASHLTGIAIGLIYGVSLYLGWLRKSLREEVAEG